MMFAVYAIWLRAWADTLQAMALPVKLGDPRKPANDNTPKPCHLRIVK